MLGNSWSLDSVVGRATKEGAFRKPLCTKTIYKYIDQGMIRIKNFHLPLKLRHKTKGTVVLKNKKILGKISDDVMAESDQLKEDFGSEFSRVFKTITSDNGSEFSDLSVLQTSDTKIYFNHPYSSFESGTNERHNGLLTRFIPKGKCISNYSHEAISLPEDWINTF